MTVKNDKLGGTDAVDGEVLSAVNYNDTNNALIIKFLNNIHGPITDSFAIIPHGGTILSHADDGTAIRNTANYQTGNISWTNKNTNVVTDVKAVHCRADKTKAVALRGDATEDGAFTTDSGTTWSDSTTNPPNQTEILDIDCPTTSLAVACGIASGNHIWRSTDGGDIWAQVSDDGTVAASVVAINMLDGTNGFAIDQDGNILSTSDGAANWSDTGRTAPDAAGNNQPSCIYAINSTTYLIGNEGILYKGTTSVDPTSKLVFDDAYLQSHFVKTADGNIYLAFIDNSINTIMLCRSTDSGDTWRIANIGPGMINGTGLAAKYTMAEAADNILLIQIKSVSGTAGIYEIDTN